MKFSRILNQLCLLVLLFNVDTCVGAQNSETETGKSIARQDSVSELTLWPQGLPADAVPLDEVTIRELKAKISPEGHLYYVESPTISVYPADPDRANGCGVVICPGGGYHILAWQHEGVELAKWFNSIGVSAFVLKYRIPRRNPAKIYWEPLQDVQRAIRLVRHRASEYKLDPNRIGTLGFSAGGHLTVMSGLQAETVTYPAIDEADAVSCRPDFICPIYAAYLAEGEKDDTASLGPLVRVTKNSPPTFMAVTWDDTFRGAQSALLFVELKKNGVPAELHAYSQGGHGYGIRPSKDPVSQWPHQMEAWLKVSGFLESK
jgi:acetyl esterase/lipase